jgi:hypothetical protein
VEYRHLRDMPGRFLFSSLRRDLTEETPHVVGGHPQIRKVLSQNGSGRIPKVLVPKKVDPIEVLEIAATPGCLSWRPILMLLMLSVSPTLQSGQDNKYVGGHVGGGFPLVTKDGDNA